MFICTCALGQRDDIYTAAKQAKRFAEVVLQGMVVFRVTAFGKGPAVRSLKRRRLRRTAGSAPPKESSW